MSTCGSGASEETLQLNFDPFDSERRLTLSIMSQATAHIHRHLWSRTWHFCSVLDPVIFTAMLQHKRWSDLKCMCCSCQLMLVMRVMPVEAPLKPCSIIWTSLNTGNGLPSRKLLDLANWQSCSLAQSRSASLALSCPLCVVVMCVYTYTCYNYNYMNWNMCIDCRCECIYIHVCIIYIHIYISLCIYIYMYVCMYVCMHIYIYIRNYAYIYIVLY